MTNQDPWRNITTPAAPESMQAHLVDSNGNWSFYWAVGIDRERYLLLVHKAVSIDAKKLPRLNGIEMTMRAGDTAADAVLSLMLVDIAQAELFHRLCTDIIAAADTASTEKEAVSIAIARSWRWHHLLRGGRDGRLSAEEQKGLIGELHVIEKMLLPNFSAADAITAWGGPLGNPIDFEINRVGIEAKARRGGSAPSISISSEHQLDDTGLDHLYLHVIEVDRAEANAEGSDTVTDIASRVAEKLGPADRANFEDLLVALGFSWSDDYSDYSWFEGEVKIFAVGETFPRITSSTTHAGVSNVHYSIALIDCEQFITSDDSLIECVKEGSNGN